uniref:Ell-associated factor Eaf n=1 Tax=Glossina pallidipes TaxID=7398 RepID=A0A1B0AGD9_GLOPL
MIVDDDEAVFGISGGSGSTNNHHLTNNIANALSSSSSTSDSDSSGSDSGSDSDDSTEDDRSTKPAQNSSQQLPSLSLGTITSSPPLHMEYSNHTQNSHHHHQYNQTKQQQDQQLNPSTVNYASNGAFPNDLLQNDLQLSSNSSDDDSD